MVRYYLENNSNTIRSRMAEMAAHVRKIGWKSMGIRCFECSETIDSRLWLDTRINNVEKEPGDECLE